jgi:hypothetical protein
MKSIRLIFTLLVANLLVITSLFAQAPERVNYQAVARDLAGAPITNTGVNLTFEILQGSASGTVTYSENQIKTTNQFGLFTAEIGGGTVTSGSFPGIAWGTNTYFLRITVNGDVMPATQLLSVPYALHAGTASSGTQGLDGVGIDSTIHNADGTLSIYYSNATSYTTNDLTGPAGPAGSTFIAGNGISIVGNTISSIDTSITNEIQTLSVTSGATPEIILSNGGNSVKLVGSGGTVLSTSANEITINSTFAGDNWGAQTVVSDSTLFGDGSVLNPLSVGIPIPTQTSDLTNNSGFITNANDADSNATNELITNFEVNGTNDSLIITEAGISHAVALSDLASSNAWTKGTGNDIFNNTDSVGIGTNNPKTALQLGDFQHYFPLVIDATEEYAITTYNNYWDGTTLRSSTGGPTGYMLFGKEDDEAMFGISLDSTSYAQGADVLGGGTSTMRLNLKSRGLAINSDNPDAALDLQPKDSSAILMDAPDDGSEPTLNYRSSQGFLLGLKVSTLMSEDYTLSYPTALPATASSPLVSDLNGNLSWGGSSPWSKTGASIHPTTLTENVGIGSNSAAYALEIKRSQAGTGALFGITNPTTGDATIHFSTGTGNFSMGRNGNTFKIAQASNLGSNVRMTIGSTGNVGFGITAAVARVHAEGFGNQALKGQNSSATTATMDLINSGGGPALTVTNGTVGIGITTPGEKLDVDGNIQVSIDGKIGTRLTTAGSNGYYVPYDGLGRSLIWNTFSSSQGILFGTSDIERMRITGSGNVGVGLTNPSEKLEVFGNTEISGDYKYASSVTRTLSIPISALNQKKNNVSTALSYLVHESYVAGYYGESGYCFFKSGVAGTDAVATAPVYLPQGAIVTELKVKWFDSDAIYDASLSLELVGFGTINSTQMAIVSTSGSTTSTAGMVTDTDVTINNATINNDVNAYYVKMASFENSTSLGIGKIVITYTVTKAD